MTTKKIQLEMEDLKVEKTMDWKTISNKGVLCYESPTKDIWEIAEGELKGNQYFTWESGNREAKKQGKRLPTMDEWTILCANLKDVNKLGLKSTGFRYPCFGGGVCNPTFQGLYWSSSIRDRYWAYAMNFNSMWIRANGLGGLTLGLCCRCLKEVSNSSNLEVITTPFGIYEVPSKTNNPITEWKTIKEVYKRDKGIGKIAEECKWDSLTKAQLIIMVGNLHRDLYLSKEVVRNGGDKMQEEIDKFHTINIPIYI